MLCLLAGLRLAPVFLAQLHGHHLRVARQELSPGLLVSKPRVLAPSMLTDPVSEGCQPGRVATFMSPGHLCPCGPLPPLKILKIIFYDHIIAKTNITEAEFIFIYSLVLH